MKKQLLILLFCLFSLPVFSQTDTLTAKPQFDPLKTYRFELLDGSVLMGVLSFYDVAKAVVESERFENEQLKSYIQDWPNSTLTA